MIKSLVKSNKITAKEMATIFFAITLMAMCTYFLNIPNSFCFGGISGLCIAISGAIGFGSPATLSSVINIILLFVGFIFLGKSFGLKTTIATLILSAELAVFEKFIPMAHTLSTEPLMEMVFSVVLHAVSAAILFNVQASSGGSDIIAMIIKKYTSVKDIGKALMICDSVVVISCYFIFGIEAGMFSTMGMCIKVFMIDSVMETFNLCKYFTIITTKPANIFNTIWPTTIFITKRTVKLNDFESNDTISIGTIRGANHNGIPLGKKVLKYPHFLFLIPINILKSKPKIDIAPTVAKCDVNVKL
jgi:uncharacterized membrane-anchored protein YitT (DUF2179 family)